MGSISLIVSKSKGVAFISVEFKPLTVSESIAKEYKDYVTDKEIYN